MSRITRVMNNRELEKGLDALAATTEAARCLLCHDAPCSVACPAGSDPARFIRSLHFTNLHGAIKTVRNNNPLAACCSRICPANKLCEDACLRSRLDTPIRIAKLERYVTDEERRMNITAPIGNEHNGKKIACIGSGPASLACAAMLSRSGCKVSLFEQEKQPGGKLSHAVPFFKLPQEIVDAELAHIATSGVEFFCNTRMSSHDIGNLLDHYDAVFVGTGLMKPKTLDIPGKELEGVYHAIDWLKTARREKPSEAGNRIVVIGDGDTAIDCATTAAVLLAAHVKLVYCRPIPFASANMEETLLAVRMGIPILTEFFPTEIRGKNGTVAEITFTGADGLSTMTLAADKIIFAIGQEQDDSMASIPEHPRLFTGGDFASGGSNIAAAIASGKRAAKAILDTLSGQTP